MEERKRLTEGRAGKAEGGLAFLVEYIDLVVELPLFSVPRVEFPVTDEPEEP